MGTRERWVEDEEVEEDGSFAATILRTIRDHPGAFLTGKKSAWGISDVLLNRAVERKYNYALRSIQIDVVHPARSTVVFPPFPT